MHHLVGDIRTLGAQLVETQHCMGLAHSHRIVQTLVDVVAIAQIAIGCRVGVHVIVSYATLIQSECGLGPCRRREGEQGLAACRAFIVGCRQADDAVFGQRVGLQGEPVGIGINGDGSFVLFAVSHLHSDVLEGGEAAQERVGSRHRKYSVCRHFRFRQGLLVFRTSHEQHSKQHYHYPIFHCSLFIIAQGVLRVDYSSQQSWPDMCTCSPVSCFHRSPRRPASIVHQCPADRQQGSLSGTRLHWAYQR